MRVVNVHEAKTNLSALLDAVLAGEEIVLARRNVPIARLVLVANARPPREPGFAQGLIEMAEDFDEPLPDFEGYRS